jgi:hypothetical protein
MSLPALVERHMVPPQGPPVDECPLPGAPRARREEARRSGLLLRYGFGDVTTGAGTRRPEGPPLFPRAPPPRRSLPVRTSVRTIVRAWQWAHFRVCICLSARPGACRALAMIVNANGVRTGGGRHCAATKFSDDGIACCTRCLAGAGGEGVGHGRRDVAGRRIVDARCRRRIGSGTGAGTAAECKNLCQYASDKDPPRRLHDEKPP